MDHQCLAAVAAFFNEPINTYVLDPMTEKIMCCADGGGPKAKNYVLPDGIRILERAGLPSNAENIIIPRSVTKMDSRITSSSATYHFLTPDLNGIELSGSLDNVKHDFNWQLYSYTLFPQTENGEYTVNFNVVEYNPLAEKR